MDRIDSAIDYLNAHIDKPQTEEGLICFLVFASMIKDGVEKLYESIFSRKPPYRDDKQYFKSAMFYDKPYFTEETCPTDDVFFEYIRALAFAHPYETSHRRERPFMKKSETHYCPWVIVNTYDFDSDKVGIRIYSNIDEESITDITFPFSALKEYIRYRYNYINELTQWVKNQKSEQEEKWASHQINRNQNPVDVLMEIKSILDERFQDADTVETAIAYLTCPLSVESNQENVTVFRDAIVDEIPKVCDCIDNLDYEGMEEAFSLLTVVPDFVHQMCNYQLEKIFTYLDSRSEVVDEFSKERWGLKQARAFSNQFAKKWVTIDVEHMEYDEIKLLVRTACYLEAKEQSEV